jgi:RND family efflux transporter MFP subunit
MEEKRVLTDFTKPRTVQDLTAKLNEAQRAMVKAQLNAKSLLLQKEADKDTKDAIYKQEEAWQKEIQAEIEKCTVKAPQDGLLVYYMPEQVRGGGGSQQSIVAQGEPVREGQKMLQIPDLNKMLANVRVPEALVSHLHSADPDDPDSWQPATIKVDAFSNRLLKGHVKVLDTVASAQDFFAADVKVYKTLVAIDETMPGLKPGMSAEVTINAEESGEPVLVVPIQSVVGTISMGAQRKVFVVGPDRQTELRDVVVGMSNERMVEIKSGLKEGEQVVQNPQPLLKDDSEMKPAKVRGGGPGGQEWQGGGGGDFGGKKDGMKKGPPGMKKGPGGPGGGFPGGPGGGPGGGFQGGPGGAPPGIPGGQRGPAGAKGVPGAWLLPPARPWAERALPQLARGKSRFWKVG